MALRAEYSLGHSEFNEFLFALVGEEKTGQQLTVLSAFARLGLDPWGEARRLADLPKDAATRALAGVIDGLPEGNWRAADTPSIAARLVGCLPRRVSAAAPSPPAGIRGGDRSSTELPIWLFRAALVATVLVIAWQLRGGGF